MKIGFIGDLHFSVKNYADMHKALQLACQVMRDEKVDVVVQLGDIFDHFNISSGQTSVATIVNAAKQPFKELCDDNICNVYITEGNHDKPVKGLQGDMYRPSIDLLEYNNGKKIIKPLTKIGTISLGDSNAVMMNLPWTNINNEKFTIAQLGKKFSEKYKDSFRILIGHFTLEGTTQHGHEMVDSEFFVSQKELKSFNAHIEAAGHIHNRQLIYPGVIMHNSLGDAGSPTGVRIVEFDDEAMTITEDKFVELRTIRWNLIETTDPSPDNIRDLIENNTDEFNRWVIRVEAKREGNVKTPANVRLDYRPKTIATTRIELDRDQVAKMGHIDMFELWAKHNNYDEESIQKAISVLKENGVS